MTSYETTLKRINLLRGHVNPSPESIEARKSPSFSVEEARKALWRTFPKKYFEGYEALSELEGITDPSLYVEDKKENMRLDTNKFFIRYVNKIFELGFMTPEQIAENIDCFLACFICLNNYDYSTLTKLMVQYGLYCKTIKNLGTEKHRELLLDGTSLRTFGCFGLTEIGHGSNVRGIETTAEFDPEMDEFVINSPTDESAKFWIGNLAKTAQNAVIFAQLITLGENKGVHAFVFPVRDRDNHVPLPRVEIGDCGDKRGAHGIDNGWIKFKNFRVSRDALLDKFGSIDSQGNYSSPISNDGKRFANSIASLSGGRVLISRLSAEAGLMTTSITLRYGTARKQFGPPGKEVPLISYPSYQYRTITKFADHLIDVIACNRMVDLWIKNLPDLLKEKNRNTNLCHGLCSNVKAFVAWDVQDTISECRRSCGGLGYAKYALFGEYLNINDLNQTWEGDNHVLMMQTQQFLFKCMRWLSKGETLPETVEFLSLSPPDLEEAKSCIHDVKGLKELFSMRANYYVHKASMEMMKDATKVKETFEKSQQFELRDMCQGYHDIYLIDSFSKFLTTISCDKTRKMFEKLLLVHMHKKILNDPVFFVKILGDEKLEEVKKTLIKSLKELQKEAVSLTDVIPYPNKILGPLGNEDLQIYDRVIQHVKATPKVSERPEWWKLTYTNSDE